MQNMAGFYHCTCANVILFGRVTRPFQLHPTSPNNIQHFLPKSSSAQHHRTISNITQHPTISNTFCQSQALPNITEQYLTSPNNAQHGWPYQRNICTQHCWHLLGKDVGLVWPRLDSNIQINSERKNTKYSSLISDLTPAYSNVAFVNLSMSALGTMGKSSDSLITMLDDLKFDKTASNIIIKKLMNIAIRRTYSVCFCRNKSWTNPELMDFRLNFNFFTFLFSWYILCICCFIRSSCSYPVLRYLYLVRCTVVLLKYIQSNKV